MEAAAMSEPRDVRRAQDSTRREFLGGLSAGILAPGLLTSSFPGRSAFGSEPVSKDIASATAASGDRLKVAFVTTEFTYRSHAHVIFENFIGPYLFNGKKTDPGVEIVSLYLDQVPKREIGRETAEKTGVPVFKTIAEALTLGGSDLAVDAVLSIGEHGRYPTNEKGQTEYPRKRFFDEIVSVFKKSGRVAPVFNDKHLSYRWDWAKEMVDTSRAMGFALMAGSSVPLAQRRPSLEIPMGSKIVEAVSIHGGGVESYDFHGLEVLQSIVESRAGAETGVASVQFLEGDALWKAAEEGLWSISLAEAALAAEIGDEARPLKSYAEQQRRGGRPHGILVNYRDGFRAFMLKVGSSATRWDFACRLEGDAPDTARATSFYVGPWDNRNLFKALSHAIQVHFHEKRPPYPVERTLLTTGILAAAMDSRFNKGTLQETPHLSVAYEPRDFRSCREMGATWEILKPDTPEPKWLDLSGRDA
jgi:hypothetical protein